MIIISRAFALKYLIILRLEKRKNDYNGRFLDKTVWKSAITTSHNENLDNLASNFFLFPVDPDCAVH
ncbi:hypothetical protein LEP1GSC058_3009 [Leptospira fainei serovar Hurstbridge str. BUT 6]|uniref:Uncharacterized protein n=1 Tax=Leptospira fainei serovar Hurstbridge str. BUT 6 TaxID=1193011 RepID=S3V1J7_9LEPT|nr:hypothetical protein LEP1GSC058_3009 [Leptospira fainei serovar Hurstbridge str. BUT 6]